MITDFICAVIGFIWMVISAILWYVILPLLSIICIYLLIINRFDNLRMKIFASIYDSLVKELIIALLPYKKKMFEELNENAEGELRHRQPSSLRILELGAGPGTNFQFYPENSRIIIVEPNKYFESNRRKNLTQWPSLTVEKTILGGGEDLSAVEDNSVDAVVATMVLCSVVNVDEVLREIYRVLKPGGKYYYLEHGCGERSTCQKLVQFFLNPVWSTTFDGCNLKRQFDKNIKNVDLFHNIAITIIPLKQSKVHQTLIGDTICGTAQKLP